MFLLVFIGFQKSFPTDMVRRCHEYRKIPVGQLSIRPLRLLIEQDIGVRFLLPRAVTILEKDILAEGDLYSGDLLSAVLSLPQPILDENADIKNRVKKILKDRQAVLESGGLSRELLRLVQDFLSFNGLVTKSS
jgi:hypothetical protein